MILSADSKHYSIIESIFKTYRYEIKDGLNINVINIFNIEVKTDGNSVDVKVYDKEKMKFYLYSTTKSLDYSTVIYSKDLIYNPYKDNYHTGTKKRKMNFTQFINKLINILDINYTY